MNYIPARKIRSSSKWIRTRILSIQGVLFIFLAIILARAFQFQVINREALLNQAESEYKTVLKIAPARGNIFDRNKEELAVSAEMDSVFVRPAKVENHAETAQQLAPILKMDRKEIIKALSTKKGFAWLKRRVPPNVAAQVMELGLPGIDL
ncbi:MAG: penicillin-binding protein, partial [Deltaproteobacteria bacterium]|nr:penicillin-binding protein [Deltaproteobacteria bacterium]